MPVTGTWGPGLRVPSDEAGPEEPGHLDPTPLQGRGPWASTVGGTIGPVPMRCFVPAPTVTAAVADLTIGPVVMAFTVIDGTQSSTPPPRLAAPGGAPTPRFSVTSDVVMELTFLPFRPRYAVEIIDVTDGIVEP